MNMEKGKDDFRKIFKIVLFAIITYWVINNFGVIGNFFNNAISILTPFILGGALAFVLNIPMSAIERKWLKPKNNKKKSIFQNKTIVRTISLILSIIFISLITFLVIKLVVPELINVFKLLIDNIPYYVEKISEFLKNNADAESGITEMFSNIDIDSESIKKELLSFISGLLTSSISIVGNLIGIITDLVIAIIFAMYLLGSKEKLQEQFKRLFRAYLSDKKYNGLMNVLNITQKTFANFFTVQCFEALLLGVLCILGMLILNIPYAVPVGVLVGVTALIPLVGGFIGVIIGAIIIVCVEPIKVITFVIFVVILQQIEANLIYPKVVGDSVGLPGMWVLVAVSVGGKLSGIVGMLIGVPLASVIYMILRNDVNKRLKQKAK